MQTNANTLVQPFALSASAHFNRLTRSVAAGNERRSQSSASLSPNHVSQSPAPQLWTSLETEQARHDFAHRVVYAVLAIGSLVPPVWALLAQHATSL
ncbi:MAG: hypothetical protein JO117_06375 [Verrucomicrobia bacterium]|nr:hypothetical protein [Verrucomicrobiota bacterium]MBV9657200.1 hypothetical protein [Verrucomicrobiota bacterium]